MKSSELDEKVCFEAMAKLKDLSKKKVRGIGRKNIASAKAKHSVNREGKKDVKNGV